MAASMTLYGLISNKPVVGGQDDVDMMSCDENL